MTLTPSGPTASVTFAVFAKVSSSWMVSDSVEVVSGAQGSPVVSPVQFCTKSAACVAPQVPAPQFWLFTAVTVVVPLFAPAGMVTLLLSSA